MASNSTLFSSAHTSGFPDRGPTVFAVTTSTLALSFIFVASRIYCRARLVKQVGLDDYFIIVAWVLAFGLCFSIDFATKNGLGRHDENINPSHYNNLRKSEYVFSVLYNPALMATKTSILLFFLRMSKNTQPIMRAVSWTLLVMVNIAGCVLTLLNIFQCRPISAAFLRHTTAKCIPLLTEFVCAAPVNIVTDLVILALPIPILTGMTLPPRQKYILVITFALWIFVSVVDVIRVYYLQQAISTISTTITSDQSAIFGTEAEFAWNASMSLMWSAVEVNVAMTCACIPTLKQLILKILPEMLIDPNKSLSRTRESTVTESPAPAPDHRSSVGPQPPPAAYEPDEQEVDIITALYHPDRPQEPRRPTAASTADAPHTRRESTVYFGFVNMRKPQSMLRVSASDSWKYCSVVAVLFFLWGLSYGFLNTLNNAVAVVANMTVAETLGLTSIYFGGGYFFGPLVVGEWILRRDEHRRSTRHKSNDFEAVGGFKSTFILGLCIYGIGTITFWPSAVLTSFTGFMICQFIVGFGLAVLETAANPFLALCGPPAYSEMRLLLAQGMQGVGAVLSQLLAQKVFFKNFGSRQNVDSRTLIDVQWTYLAITLFCVFLALFFYYMPLPEVSDHELELAANRIPVNPGKRGIGGFSLSSWSLGLAIMAQWTYVAVQENVSIFSQSLLTVNLPGQQFTSPTYGASTAAADKSATEVDKPPGLELAVSDYVLVARSAFAVSRFIAGYFTYLSPTHPRIPRPRTILAMSTLLAFTCGLVTVVIHPSNNNLLVIPVVLLYFAEGPIWPLIFAIGLRGQGKRTKRAAAFITMGGSGPAFFPFVIYGIVKTGGSTQTAFIVVPVLLLISAIYPLYLVFVKDAGTLVDPPDPLVDKTGHPGLNAHGATVREGVHSHRLSGTTLKVSSMSRKSFRKDRKRSTTSAESGS